jgi:hypothetical protein
MTRKATLPEEPTGLKPGFWEGQGRLRFVAGQRLIPSTRCRRPNVAAPAVGAGFGTG